MIISLNIAQSSANKLLVFMQKKITQQNTVNITSIQKQRQRNIIGK